MNQAVCAPCEIHEGLARLRISGNDHGVPRRIDAISKRRFHSSMIDEKYGDSRQTIIVDFPLCDFLRINFDSFGMEEDREGPDEYGYQKQMPEQGAPSCSKSLEDPRFVAVCFGPKTIPKATNPGFQQHGRSEDE